MAKDASGDPTLVSPVVTSYPVFHPQGNKEWFLVGLRWIESASWPCSRCLSVALLASSSWPTTTECPPCLFPGTPLPFVFPLTELTITA